MPTVITIPLTTLVVGVDITTPAQDVSTFTSFVFSLARDAGATPLNGLAQGVNAFTMFADYSFDGGVSWALSDSQTIAGGIFLDKQGVASLVSAWGTGFPNGTTHARARVTPIQSCTTQGSLTLSP